MASQVGGFTDEITTAVGCAVGQAIGKVGIVLAPSGQSFPYGATATGATRAPPQAGRSRSNQAQGLADRLLELLGDHRWGIPIVFLSACLAIPPLYPVTLAVPATRMSVIPFGVAVFLGRMVLFLAIAFGVSALID